MTPSLVKIDIVPSSAVSLTLIRDVEKLLNVSACLAFDDKDGKDKLVTCFPLLFSPLATITRLVDGRNIGRRAASLSFFADVMSVRSGIVCYHDDAAVFY